MKKLLIIQQDEAYFLFETLQVVEKYWSSFKDFDLTILVDEHSLGTVYTSSAPLLKCLATDTEEVIKKDYDLSVNLSLNEKTWKIHGDLRSPRKLGPYFMDGRLCVADVWSSYLLTLKGKAPFLTFHLQDLYKNILGIRNRNFTAVTERSIKKLAFGSMAVNVFSGHEQEELVNELSKRFPKTQLLDISELDLVSDLSDTVYIGPATLEALKFSEAGGKGIFLSSAFQGFNLMPYGVRHKLISSRGEVFKASKLVDFIEKEITGEGSASLPYSLYSIEHENIFGAYLKGHNVSDDNYPIYQSHVVLWNFLLNLFDVNLPITKCGQKQIDVLKTQQEVLKKYIRLHDYAMTSIDTIYQETKTNEACADKINGHMKNLTEIEKISDQIASSHPYLRQVLDFYRIRKGQNDGRTLYDQSQSSYLTYSEEHQALEALHELFSVTLKKNEVNI